MTHVRGKARFMYELSFQLKFTFTSTSTGNDNNNDIKYNGVLKFIEVCNDCDDNDIDIIIEWKKGTPPKGKILTTLRKYLLSDDSILRTCIRHVLTDFENDFNQL